MVTGHSRGEDSGESWDIDPLTQVPVLKSQKRVKKGSLLRAPLLLPRTVEPWRIRLSSEIQETLPP